MTDLRSQIETVLSAAIEDLARELSSRRSSGEKYPSDRVLDAKKGLEELLDLLDKDPDEGLELDPEEERLRQGPGPLYRKVEEKDVLAETGASVYLRGSRAYAEVGGGMIRLDTMGGLQDGELLYVLVLRGKRDD